MRCDKRISTDALVEGFAGDSHRRCTQECSWVPGITARSSACVTTRCSCCHRARDLRGDSPREPHSQGGSECRNTPYRTSKTEFVL